MPPGPGKLKKQASGMLPTDIPKIVGELKDSESEGKEQLAHLLSVLALHNPDNPPAIVSAGAIKPLVDLITSGTDGAQMHAASTLATIAASSQPFQDKIVDAGGIVPVCKLLSAGSNRANCFAAAAVASLADQPKHQEPIIKAGACQPLVRLVRPDVTVDTQLHAADAIADLSSQNPRAQKIFHAAGAVPLLLYAPSPHFRASDARTQTHTHAPRAHGPHRPSVSPRAAHRARRLTRA